MSDEVIRQLIELSLNAGKKRLNSQTGFIHANYHSLPGEEAFTIPVLENVYYILTLFRTKNADNITQGKALLEKILSFQCPFGHLEEGNFPIYLHEFPTCYDQYQAIHLLPPFYWLLKQFHTILGTLKTQLIHACERLILCALKHYQKGSLPYLFAVKFTAAYLALQEFLSLSPLDVTIDHYKDQSQEWNSTKAIKEVLISLQMLYPSLADSPWNLFWNHLQSTWHPALKTYIGPAFKEFQKGLHPQGSLYDLYCGYFTGKFSSYSLKDDLFHLQGSLIQPSKDRFEAVYPCEKTDVWMFSSQEICAINAIFHPSEYYEKGHHFFRVLWGASEFIHSLVCQGGNIQKLSAMQSEKEVRLDFTLGNLFDFEDRDRQREISFYLNLAPETRFLIEGQPSNTFTIDDHLLMKVGQSECKLRFDILEGQGKFMGHIIRGNRPAQTLNKGILRYEAYDWHVFLRTIQREDKCRISVTFSFAS